MLFLLYREGMDWQQPVALAIVAVTATVMFLARFRRRRDCIMVPLVGAPLARRITRANPFDFVAGKASSLAWS